MRKNFVVIFGAVALLMVGCKSAKKALSSSGVAIAEFRYSAEIGNAKGYTFYRFYGDKTFSRGAYGSDGKQTVTVETERGTYEGNPKVEGELKMTVTSTMNWQESSWIESKSADTETGKIQGSTFVFNGITYTKATK